ncbi:MAG: hypothetical protein DRJ42_12420 [Deltaproteobacteria bacterium]|nr:MAG: hypothetical protein DRJ42_12420 [Deltaproteobacteria bacterium]
MHVMGLREVRDRLSERLELLSAGPRDVPGRQRSLEAALSWSWRQLTAAERGALSQCTCFRGGFDVAAATAVIDLTCFEGAPAVLDVVQSLVEQSLITVRDSPGPRAGRRLGLLRSIDDFVLARLADSSSDDIRCDAGVTARHGRHFVGIAEGWMGEWERREDHRALARLRLERENLLAAAQGALGEPDTDPTMALRAALVLQPVVSAWGPIRPQLDLVEQCLRAAAAAAPGDAPVDARLEARALLVRGRLRMTFSGVSAAEVDWQRALDLAAEAGDSELEGRARHGVATAAHVQGELPEAREHYERSLELLRPEGNRRALGRLLLDLGMLHEEMGDLDKALDCVEEARGAAGEARDDLAGAVLASRGNVHLEMGHLDLAQESLLDALAICRAEGFRLLEGQVLGDLAVTTLLRGEAEESCAQLGAALAILEEVDDRRLVCVFSGYLAVAHHAAGNLEVAAERYDWAHRGAVELGFRRYEGIFAALGAMAYADQGRPDEAVRRLGISVESKGERDDPVIDGVVELARGQLALGEARAGARSGLSSEAETRFRAARAHAGPRAGARSRDLALAQMLFVQASETTAAVIGTPELAEESRVRLTVDGEGRWFRIGAEAVTDLGRRSAVRRLLVALARHHAASPGVPFSSEDLTAAVWPGEKMSPKSAKNRLHVALSNLRKAGLGSLLVTGEGGYLFDPSVDVCIADAPE